MLPLFPGHALFPPIKITGFREGAHRVPGQLWGINRLYRSEQSCRVKCFCSLFVLPVGIFFALPLLKSSF